MTETAKIMFEVFGDPLDAFSPSDTTELECARVWLSMTDGVRLMENVKKDLVTKLTKRLLNHWKCLGRFSSVDLDSDSVWKVVRQRVKTIVVRVETVRKSGTKMLGNESKINSTRTEYNKVITLEDSKPEPEPEVSFLSSKRRQDKNSVKL